MTCLWCLYCRFPIVTGDLWYKVDMPFVSLLLISDCHGWLVVQGWHAFRVFIVDLRLSQVTCGTRLTCRWCLYCWFTIVTGDLWYKVEMPFVSLLLIYDCHGWLVVQGWHAFRVFIVDLRLSRVTCGTRLTCLSYLYCWFTIVTGDLWYKVDMSLVFLLLIYDCHGWLVVQGWHAFRVFIVDLRLSRVTCGTRLTCLWCFYCWFTIVTGELWYKVDMPLVFLLLIYDCHGWLAVQDWHAFRVFISGYDCNRRLVVHCWHAGYVFI